MPHLPPGRGARDLDAQEERCVAGTYTPRRRFQGLRNRSAPGVLRAPRKEGMDEAGYVNTIGERSGGIRPGSARVVLLTRTVTCLRRPPFEEGFLT